MYLFRSVGYKEVSLLLSLYFLANITYLLNINGLYWDDWVAYNQEYSTLIRFFDEIKNSIHGYFFLLLSKLGNGIYIFRITLFIMYFLSGIIIIYILNSIKKFNKLTSLIIGSLYLLYPAFHTKVALSIIPFYFPVFLFFLAFYILARTIDNHNIKSRIIVLVLFFISFTTNSLLVFYGLVLLYILYKKYFEEINHVTFLEKIFLFCKKYFDYILLPILFFIFRSIFLKPYGLYANYNSIDFDKLLHSIPILFKSFDLALFQTLRSGLDTGWPFVSVAIAASIIVFILIKRRTNLDIALTSPAFMLIIGLLGFFTAIFPYAAVGKIPVASGWNSRFQILTILPSVMILLALILFAARVLNRKYEKAFTLSAITFFALLFIGKNFYDQHRFNVDWFYQSGIQQQFISSQVIRNNHTFVVDNKIRPSLAYSRHLVYYEWNGLLKKTFDDDSRLMVPPFFFNRLNKMHVNQHYKQYNFSKWRISPPILVTIDYHKRLSRDMILKLYWNRLFDNKQYLALCKELVILSYNKIISK